MSLPAGLAETIRAKRAELEEAHRKGSGGFEICKLWSRFLDELIRELYESVSGGKESLPFALAALGGYGREELNPYSDIDLLFVFNAANVPKNAAPVKIIPLLWDIGFKVGHSTRSIDDCIKIAAQDSISKTSMMEARFLLGDIEAFNVFFYRFKSKVISKEPLRFLREKKEETEIRHKKFSNTLYLTEPDIKESPGGLRDYHLGLWVATARYGARNLPAIIERGLIGSKEADAVTESVSFLLRMRNDMHFLKGAAYDLMDYAIQPPLAERLGYKGETKQAVIEMMRDYYRSADTLFRFGKSIMGQAKRYRSRAQMFLIKLRTRQLAPSIFAGPDEILVKGMTTASLASDPQTLFSIFRFITEKELKPSQLLRKMLDEVGRKWKEEKPNQSELSKGFRTVINTPDPVEALRLLRDSKLLTAVIPEFHSIRYLTPFDMYHKFTVDDHSFLAIRIFDNLKRNENPECDLLRAIYDGEGNREIIRIAILLHDIGKGDGTHADEDEIDPGIVERLGYSKQDAEHVCTLIRLHLLMNNIAQRRDIHDIKTITEFCAKVGDVKILNHLYLLTYADTRAVGPDVWNSWKASLLKNLYIRAIRHFEGKIPLQRTAPEHFLNKETITPEEERFIKGMPDRYLLIRRPEEIEKDAALFERYRQGTEHAIVEHGNSTDGEPGEIIVITKNRIGLLYKVVGTLFSKNIDILQSQVSTHKDGIAVDFFRVNGPDGKPITDEPFIKRVEAEIKRVLGGEKSVAEVMAQRRKTAISAIDAPLIDDTVKVLNDVSYDHTVIEITTRDRPALLYEITRAVAGLHLDIISARASTEGHKVVDTFYVSEKNGEKVLASERSDEIKRTILTALAR